MRNEYERRSSKACACLYEHGIEKGKKKKSNNYNGISCTYKYTVRRHVDPYGTAHTHISREP